MRRIRLVSQAAAAATLLALTVGGTAGAVAAPRATGAEGATVTSPAHTFLDSGTLRVKDSHHEKLNLTLSANAAQFGNPDLTVTLSTGKEFVAGETHQWNFGLKKSGFTVNTSSGKARIATGKKLGTFGRVGLTFTRTSSSNTTCTLGDAPETILKGKLSGKLYFNSHTKWGAVGTHHKRIRVASGNTVTLLSSGCGLGGGGSASCVKGTSWSAPYDSANDVSVNGSITKSGSHTVSTVTVSRNVTIAKPLNASRYDTLIVKEPVPTVHGNSISITTSGHAITGSAAIKDGSGSPNDYPCKHGGATMTEKTETYSGTWSDSAFVVHFQATGKWSPPPSGSASFTTETY